MEMEPRAEKGGDKSRRFGIGMSPVSALSSTCAGAQQIDLDLIEEFLNEQNPILVSLGEGGVQGGMKCTDQIRNLQAPQQITGCLECPSDQPRPRGLMVHSLDSGQSWDSDSPNSNQSPCCSPTPQPDNHTIRTGKRGQRLFEFLYAMLQDPSMQHCIQWVQGSTGTFQFSSQHKESVAELWGVRKGNRKTMTYQKMARALRNYSITGKICKVKCKLTYCFSEQALRSLRPVL